MAVFKICMMFLLVAMQAVHSKPLLFKELEMKNNFEFSLKPFLKPLTFIKEKWSPFGNFGVKHTVEKRSPFALPPVNPGPPPAPLFKIALEKSINISPMTTDSHHHTEIDLNNEASPHTAGSPGHVKFHDDIHEEHHPKIAKLLAVENHDHEDNPPIGVHINHFPVLPESHEKHLPVHIGIPPVSPELHSLHDGPDGRLQEHAKLSGTQEGHLCPCPLQNAPPPQVDAVHEHHLEELPREIGHPHHAATSGEGTFLELSKPSSAVVHHERERINKLPREVEHEGTLEGLLRPHEVGNQEERVPIPDVDPHHTSVLPPGVTGPTFPGFTKQTPAEIQKTNAPPLSSLFTDISRVTDINAYLKAVDALPLVKPPLEENIQGIPGNSLEAVGPKDLPDDTSSLARGSRLALYFGNILLQVMSQAIGGARSAFSQYSKPSAI